MLIYIYQQRCSYRGLNKYSSLNNSGQSYPVFAASVFKGAENECAAAVVLHMVSQILSGNVGCATLVWALHRKPRAVVLVVLQGGGRVNINVCIDDRQHER